MTTEVRDRSLPLRGREKELTAVRERLTQISQGAGGVFVVEGSAGLGKTRLIDDSAKIATELGFRVGRGGVEPYRRVTQLGALFHALFEGTAPLANRRSLGSSHASPEFLYWLIQDLESIIEEAALKEPVLICLDDLHWATASCSVAMRQLTERLSALPVAWIMAFRSDQGVQAVQDARDHLVESGAEYIQLGPLERSAVAQIVADILGARPDEELLQRAETAQGNPFLLVEFLRGLQDDGIVKYEADVVSLTSDRLPRRLGDGMRGRLGRLSPESERAATFASSLGRRFTLHDISALTSLPLGELVDPVTELIDADIFVDDGDCLAFRHDMIREAIRASLLSPVRKGLDRQAADVLLARGALPSEVAMQLADSAEPGDDVAIEILLKAAEQLATTDPAGSASLAQRGLELSPERHSLRGALVVQRVVSLFAAGMAEEGKAFADSALRRTLPAHEEAKVRFSVASMFDLSPEVRAESARAGLALPNLSTDLKASLWASLYHSLAVAGRTDQALAIEEKAKDAAYASTDQANWLAYELARSGLQYQLLAFGDSLSTAVEGERRDLRGREDPRVRLTRLFHAWVLIALDRFHEATDLINDGVMAAQRDRQNWALRIFETTGARLMLQQGLIAEASAALEGRFSVAEAHLVAGALHAPSVVTLAKLMIHTGDDRAVQDVGDIASVMLRSDARVVRNAAIWVLALIASSKGNATQAHSWLCNDGLDARLTLFPLFPHELTDDVQLVRIAKAVSDEELGERVLSMTEQRAALNFECHFLSSGSCARERAVVWIRGRSCTSNFPFEKWPETTRFRFST